MKVITIVRHANASPASGDQHDAQRLLDEQGLRDARLMASRIKAAGAQPDRFISSPAARAISTAKTVAAELNYPLASIEQLDKLYLAPTQSIFELLAEQPVTCEHLMLVGHNPGLTDFVNLLLADLTHDLPTAGVVTIDCIGQSASWDLRHCNQFALRYFDYPRKPQS